MEFNNQNLINFINGEQSFECINEINELFQIKKKFRKTNYLIEHNFIEPNKGLDRLIETSPIEVVKSYSKTSITKKNINKKKEKIGVRNSTIGLGKIDINVESSFSQSVFEIIINRGFSDVDVYKNAHISKMVFSKIRNNNDYQPSKDTALQLCVGLKLNLEETIDLLSRASYALNPHSIRDKIITYFILNEIYDLDQINETLYKMDLKLFPLTYLR